MKTKIILFVFIVSILQQVEAVHIKNGTAEPITIRNVLTNTRVLTDFQQEMQPGEEINLDGITNFTVRRVVQCPRRTVVAEHQLSKINDTTHIEVITTPEGKADIKVVKSKKRLRENN